MSFTFSQLFFASVLSAIIYALLRTKRPSSFPFPPGPNGLPLIGNLLDVPFKYQWLTYEKWGQKMGSDIVHVELFGRHMVVLNSQKAANDLLEKRSSIYSDRPRLKALSELLDVGHWVIAFFPYGNKWRTWHKAFYAHMQQTVVRQYHPIELKATRRLLWNLFDTPQDFMKHLRYMVGQVSLSIAYGIDTAPRNDPHIALADAALQGVYVAQTKGRIFNLVPFLIHLPWWFPGAGFKKEADTWKHKMNRCRDEVFEIVKKELGGNSAVPSVAASMITGLSEGSSEEEILMAKGLPASIYLSGIDTSAAALQSFVLAMVLYPEVQRRAQEEIDSVLGHGHLPKFGDEDALPYLKAVLHELLRWSPPGPLGLPHRLTEDDVYDGYFLPAGSLIFANIWAIFHDPVTYPEPSKFKPERFLDPVTPAPLPTSAFGFGRRFCLGRHFARDMVWVAMFLPALDAEGRPEPPAQEFISLLVSGPVPFNCLIKPRIPNAKETLLVVLQD